MARSFTEPDVPRNQRLIDLVPEDRAHFVDDLTREIGPVVIHRHQDAFDGQFRVQGGTDPFDRVDQLGDAFQRQVFALNRNQHRIGGGKRIEGQQAERRGAVDHDEIVQVTNLIQPLLQPVLPRLGIHEFDLGADQVAVRGVDPQVGEIHGLEPHFLQSFVRHQRVVERRSLGIILESECPRRVGLRVGIDEERRTLGDGQCCGETDGGRRLADAALLIDDGDDLSHAPTFRSDPSGSHRGSANFRDPIKRLLLQCFGREDSNSGEAESSSGKAVTLPQRNTRVDRCSTWNIEPGMGQGSFGQHSPLSTYSTSNTYTIKDWLSSGGARGPGDQLWIGGELSQEPVDLPQTTARLVTFSVWITAGLS